MSTKNKKGSGVNCKRTPKKQIVYRIFALALAILMLGGMIFYALFQMSIAAGAALSYSNPQVAVGLRYGTSVTVGFQTETINGFTVGSAVITRTERDFSPIWTIEQPKVITACDANLFRVGAGYNKATGTTVTIGGYHLQLDAIPSDRNEAEQLVSTVNSLLADTNYYAIPSYINGAFRVRVGHFSASSAAEAAADTLTDLKNAYPLSVVEPSDTGVTVINPDKNSILFEYDCKSDSSIGLYPIQSPSGKTYTKAAVSEVPRIYDGVFVYKRYKNETVDGVSVINLIHLEDYVAGVIPWEISASWHYETQRVFAISARTFAMQRIYHHWAYGFDVCNTTHCQAYLGCERANDNVYNAIAATRGMVLSYNNNLAKVFYSSSSGGETINAYHAWGGGQPGDYLVSQKTPWERYSIRSYGVWKNEVSPEDLRDYLYNGRGYDVLKGSRISSITINSYAGETGYVQSITFRDSSGNAVTVNTSDGVRTALAKYVNSANFVVGKDKVTRSYDVVNSLAITPVEEKPTLYEKISSNAFNVIDQFNQIFYSIGAPNLASPTGSGIAYAPTNTENDTSQVKMKTAGTHAANIIVDKTTVTETITATKNGNFVFAGRGWGHGVGISQHGALDLAQAGGTAEFILDTYLPGIQIVSYGEFE